VLLDSSHPLASCPSLQLPLHFTPPTLSFNLLSNNIKCSTTPKIPSRRCSSDFGRTLPAFPFALTEPPFPSPRNTRSAVSAVSPEPQAGLSCSPPLFCKSPCELSTIRLAQVRPRSSFPPTLLHIYGGFFLSHCMCSSFPQVPWSPHALRNFFRSNVDCPLLI